MASVEACFKLKGSDTGDLTSYLTALGFQTDRLRR